MAARFRGRSLELDPEIMTPTTPATSISPPSGIVPNGSIPFTSNSRVSSRDRTKAVSANWKRESSTRPEKRSVELANQWLDDMDKSIQVHQFGSSCKPAHRVRKGLPACCSTTTWRNRSRPISFATRLIFFLVQYFQPARARGRGRPRSGPRSREPVALSPFWARWNRSLQCG